jgi:hypothetical protein
LKKLAFFTTVLLFLFCATAAFAQGGDAFFGFGTVKATSASNASGKYQPQSVGGGLFLDAGGDILFMKNFGVGGEVAWRASRALYQGVIPFRPLFYDFNAVYAPPLGKAAAADLEAGIGAESIRVYTGQYQCGFSGCTNYTSSNHFMGHFAAGIKVFKGSFFVRPEVHFYIVRNNTDFSGPWAARVGASIGYSFGAH